jgi:hypothetical protein
VAVEAIAWPQPPTSTDANDGPTASYVMGCEFEVSEATECPGVRWRVPDSVSTPPAPASGHYAMLWNQQGGGRLALQAFTPAPGGDQDILFAAPVPLSSGIIYAAAVLTVHYTYRSGASFPYATPNGVAMATTGKLSATSDPDDPPLGNTGLVFYVSPLIGADDGPAEGSAALGLGLAVAAAGGADAEGSAALDLGFAVAAAGARRAQGAVALDLGLNLAAAGARDSLGTAAFGLDLSVSSSGVHASAGASALSLNLALAAQGSDGQAGRPVTPWPYGAREVSGYPWAPRPVKSFSGEVG